VTGLPDWRKMWDFQDPAASAERFREAIGEGEAAGDDVYVAIVTTQLARTQGLQERFAAAHELLDSVAPKLDRLPPEVSVRYELERGRALNSGDRQDESVPHFQEAWDLAREAQLDALAVDAAHMMAIVLPPEPSLQWTERALGLCESSVDPGAKGWLGPLYNNAGWTYFDMGEVEKALELWEKGLAIRQEAGDPVSIAIARYTVARAWRALGRNAKALAECEAIRAYREEAGLGDDGFLAEEIAENLLALGRNDEATPLFKTAWELLQGESWLATHEPERWARLRELGGA